MKFKKFFNECREKEVFKNLSIYVVTSWVLIQVFSAIWEPLGLPKITITFVLLVLLAGFPLYGFFLWKFQLQPMESKKPILDKKGNPIPGAYLKSSFQRMYYTSLSIIGLISICTVLLIIKTNFFQVPAGGSFETKFQMEGDDKIAILKFDNNTTEEKFNVVGKMAVDWIMHGITQNKVGQVISPKIIDDYSNVLKKSILPSSETNELNVLTEYLKPSKIINGNFYLKNNRLLFQCSITDAKMNNTLISFKPVECDSNDPLECIEALKQRILGYLVTEDEKIDILQETPPNFEAYQYLDEAKSQYGNNDEYLKLLNKSIAADSTYVDPKLDRLDYYYNEGDFKIADSLLQILSKDIGTNKRQINLLNYYEALLQGNNRNIYNYLQKDYNIIPFDIYANSSMMVIALQFVNKPQDIDTIFNEINMQGLDLENCVQCGYRYYSKAMADIELQRYDDVIDLLAPLVKTNGTRLLIEALVRAYIRSGNSVAADDLLVDLRLRTANTLWKDICLFAGKEFLLMGSKKKADYYFDQLIETLNDASGEDELSSTKIFASALLFKEDYAQSEKVLKELIQLSPDMINQTALLAIVYHKNGKTQKAQELVTKLDGLRTDYQYGSIDYALAQYYAAIKDENNTIKHLIKAIASGHRYRANKFRNDPLLIAYSKSESFDRIMRFWH